MVIMEASLSIISSEGLVDKRTVCAAQSDYTSGSRQRICGVVSQNPGAINKIPRQGSL